MNRFLIVFAILLGCSSGIKTDFELHGSSSPQKPGWITHPIPEDKQNYYFIGKKIKSKNLQNGEADAITDGIQQIMNSLGIKMGPEYNRMRTETTAKLFSQFTKRGSGETEGIRLKASYYEKWHRMKGEVYDVYVLFEYSKSKHKSMVEKITKKNKKNAENGYNLYLKGRENEQYGKIEQGLDYYEQSLKCLENLTDVVKIPNPKINNTSILKRILKSKIDLLDKKGLALSDVAKNLVENLAKRVPGNTKVFLSDFTFGNSEIGGHFTRYFYSQLKAVLCESKKFNIAEKVPVYEKTGYIIDGKYWDLKDFVEITASLKLKEDFNTTVITESKVSVSKTSLKDALFLPSHYDEQLRNKIKLITNNRPYGPYGTSKLKVELWTDRGPSGVYLKGDTLKIYIKTNRDCCITLLNFTADGGVVLLLSEEVEANQVHIIPIVASSCGTDILKLFASKSRLNVDDALKLKFPEEIISAFRNFSASLQVYTETSATITTILP